MPDPEPSAAGRPALAPLSPFSVLPDQNKSEHATVQIVGTADGPAQAVGEQWTARSLQLRPGAMGSITVRISYSAPLERPDLNRPRVNFIVFVVDVTSRPSWDIFKTAATGLDPRYKHGRCAVLVVWPESFSPEKLAVPEDIIANFAAEMEIQTLYANLSAPADVDAALARLEQAVKMASGYLRISQAVMGSLELGLLPTS